MEAPLKKLFTFGAETADHVFNRLGRLTPMWIGVNGKGSHLPLIIADLSDKDAVADAVRSFLKKNGITRYVMIAECWMYKGKKIPNEVLEGKSIKNNRDRREAIHVFAEDNKGNSISGRFYILRPEHGKPKLSPLKMDAEKTKSEGRFVGMFEQ